MSDTGNAPVRFAREMGITHRAFIRTLKGAVEGRTYTVVDGAGICASCAVINDGPRQIRIHLAPQWVRRIASIKMPVTDVTFEFDGHTQVEADAIMARFEIFFRRGGG